MDDLTKAQRAVLKIIIGHQQLYGRSPTVREICKRYGCQINAVACHLKALERKRYLRKLPGARGIVVVEDATAWTLWGAFEIGA